VVLVAFSDSNQEARVFAGRYPEKTAALYLIDPWMPEFDVVLGHDPRRLFARWIFHDLVASTFGLVRLQQRLQSWQGPQSLVEQRAEAALARRPHYWALTKEWYTTPVSVQQTRDAPVSRTLPLEVVFPTPFPKNKDSDVIAKLRAELVARSDRGRLIEVEHMDHEQLTLPGPVFDRIVARVKQLSQAGAS
jgi:pimeloyl-ACP methyl ester carboxylesterase